jgi:hypothetical protein
MDDLLTALAEALRILLPPKRHDSGHARALVLVEMASAPRTAIALAGNCHGAYVKARPSVRRRFNDAVLKAVYLKDRRIDRTEFSEVFAPLFFRPSSNKALKVDPRGFEPLTSWLPAKRSTS